jgi:S-formylglutathione hydrolase FrmB
MMPVKVVTPERAPSKGRSLLVFLHGRNEDERTYLVEPMFEALADLRGRAPVVAFPRAGATSYWHDRSRGPWASYVLDEVIPALVDRFDIDPRRIAIGGISMGGFGAYDIARLEPGRFCAVGGHSPVIWQSAGEAADGAFDDANDFAHNDLVSLARERPSPFAGPRLWIDHGTDDPFLDGDHAFESALRGAGLRPIVKSWPGGHGSDYWNAHWPEYLNFYAHSLNHCSGRVGPLREGRLDARERPPGAVRRGP